MKSRIIALILIAVLTLGCFTGCSSEGSFTAASPTDTSVENGTEQNEPLTYSTFDYDAAYDSYAPEAVVMTVNGTEITWEEYFGWLFSMIEQYEMYLGTDFEWDGSFSESYTFDSYAKYYAQTMCAQYAVVNQLAEENALELTDEDKQYIEDLLASDAESYAGGDIDAFIKYLESTFMSEEYYRFINTVAIYYQKLFEHNFGVEGANMTDEDVKDFIETNGYLYAKHILFLTTDDTGAALDDAAKAEKLAQAEDALAQLRAISDEEELVAKFDELMMSLSEDTGLAYYPDGYYFLPGEMVTEFEEGTKALDYNTVSDIIESSYGYHIILRLPITPDSEYEEGTDFRYVAATYAYDTLMGEKFSSAEIVYTEEFENFNLADIFSKIELEY